MEFIVTPTGQVRALYTEVLDLAAFGPLHIQRASRVEPDAQGSWHADLTLVGGPGLGPFDRRSEALAAEVAWLHAQGLPRPDTTPQLDRPITCSS